LRQEQSAPMTEDLSGPGDAACSQVMAADASEGPGHLNRPPMERSSPMGALREAMTALQRVDAWGTKVTKAGVEQLEKSLPNVSVRR